MYGAIPVVVIADRAVKKMVAKNAVERLDLRGSGFIGLCGHLHSRSAPCRTGPDEVAVYFDHASIAGLDWAELSVIADVRKLLAETDEHVDQKLIQFDRLGGTVNYNFNHVSPSPTTVSKSVTEPDPYHWPCLACG